MHIGDSNSFFCSAIFVAFFGLNYGNKGRRVYLFLKTIDDKFAKYWYFETKKNRGKILNYISEKNVGEFCCQIV